MNNEIAEVKKPRDIDTVTAEIKDLCTEAQRMVLLYASEIGRRLVEAKEILPHGEWGNWLKEQVGFSQSTANKHMQIFRKYGNPQVSLFGAELKSETFTNLNYSQAVKLLVLPDDELESFIKENDVGNKSIRELDKLIKERDEARAEAEAAQKYKTEMERAEREAEESRRKISELETAQAEYSSNIDELTSKLDKAKAMEKKAKDKLKAMRENPDIPQETIDKLKAEAESKAAEESKRQIEEKLSNIKNKMEEAQRMAERWKQEAECAKTNIDNLKKQVQLSNPAVTEFKAVFENVQQQTAKMYSVLEKIGDAETKQKLCSAIKMFFDKSMEKIG